MTRLYDLTSDWAALLDIAENGEDVGAALERITGAIEAKAEGIVHVLANLEADAGACSHESKRLADKARARNNAADRIRDYVRTCMQVAGVRKIQGPTFTITLANGKARVDVHDLAALKQAAPELVRTTVEEAPDKAAILARFKQDGEILPGVSIEPTTTLRVL